MPADEFKPESKHVQEFLVNGVRPRDLTPIPDQQRPRGCQGCPFGGLKVGSRGPVDSPFVIVGESPGPNELIKGYPFVGDSGLMMDATLREVGWDPKVDPEPYITNALQCVPRQKELRSMQSATNCCQNRLYEELAAHPRKVILGLGASASWTLTNNFGLKITQDRGHFFEHPLAEIGVVIALHPAYLMRTSVGYSQWKKDLGYAVALLKGLNPKDGQWVKPLWGVIENREQFEAFVNRMDAANFIASDIETSGLHFQKNYMFMIGFTSDLSQGKYVDIVPAQIIWDNEDLAHRLFGNSAQWIWQNGKFDIKFLRYEGFEEARVDEDTMLLSYALNENKGHDLDQIAWDWIGAPRHKDAIEKWFRENGIPRKKWNYDMVPKMEIMYPYAAYDISKTYFAFWKLREAVKADKNLEKLYTKTLIPASEFLACIELAGLSLDPDRVNENITYLVGEIAKAEEPIQVYARQFIGHNINIGSWQQLQQLLYNRMKLGNIGSSTDEDALIQIQRKHAHPIANHLLRWRKLKKQLGTYVIPALPHWDAKGKNLLPGWGGVDGRVHCSFKLHGTTTGRLASSDPNMQNIPRDPRIRGQFVASPGKVLIETDLNQAELRCLAIMSNDPTLVEIYTRNEVSIHHITSVAMFGEHYDDDQKMRAKAVNFGIVYGRTASSLAEEFNITISEAEDYIRIWFERYPVARNFIAGSRDAPRLMRTMINAFGRKKRWGVVTDDNRTMLENEAANWPHQSTAHDITLNAGIRVHKTLKRVWGIDMVNEIHDALYQEANNDPDFYKPPTAYVQHVMTQVPKEFGLVRVPFLAEAKAGDRWGRDYMKGFETTPEHLEEAFEMIRRAA